MAKTNEKITKRDRFVKTIEFLNAMDLDEAVRDEYIKFYEHEIELVDNKAAKAKETAAKNTAATDEIYDLVKDAMTADFKTIGEIVAAVANDEVTHGRAQYRLRVMVENGVAEKQEITVPGTNGAKARKLTAFRLIQVD